MFFLATVRSNNRIAASVPEKRSQLDLDFAFSSPNADEMQAVRNFEQAKSSLQDPALRVLKHIFSP
jgi:hypothetical protein